MSTEKYGDMPPRPPLSVPFPLQLGDDFHLGSVEAVQEAAKFKGPPKPLAGEGPSAGGGHEPGH